ncbi:hypothetical protein PV10_06383 [Exophiala mesophila]|uniref:Uncharacterized protein n=1 Tax=Exophiala mesophila TaxID=212818 RepID=A0A0D1ZB30_EXOME|nr:uncharacterized protein PV10_06383 [Exophiala mesophila]KIV91892.1 hypothetical protein PV10_06383 [Exophiala mesophila]
MLDSHMLLAQAQAGHSYSRPYLTRSRSQTNPAPSVLQEQSESQDGRATNEPVNTLRPTHSRSKSYLPPSSHEHSKTRTILTGPVASAASAIEKSAERLPRLHLPGSSHRHHQHTLSHSHSSINSKSQISERSSKHERHRRGHRSTQSEAHAHKPRGKSRDGLPHLVAGLNAERASHQHHQQYQQYQARDAFGPSDTSMADFASGGRFDLLTRSNTQARNQTLNDSQQADAGLTRRPSTVSEIMARGDAAKFAKRLHVKKHEIEQRDVEIAEAEEELRSRIGQITSTGVEITRRLDYGYYNLLEKVNSLVGTITSFQSLSRQTEVMIHNFDKETQRMESDARRRIAAFHEGMDKRAEKGRMLKERGDRVGAKAEELEARLENARIILQNLEAREERDRERWRHVSGFMRWSLALFVGVVLVLALSKSWWADDARDVVSAMTMRSTTPPHPHVVATGVDVDVDVDVDDVPTRQTLNFHMPDDVRELMRAIAAKRHLANRTVEVPGSGSLDAAAGTKGVGGDHDEHVDVSSGQIPRDDDPRLRRLDEL